MELGETMADNLVSKGVSDADASDGLTTLAEKILDIESGSGSGPCIRIKTNKNPVYSSIGSSPTLEITLYEGGNPIPNANVELYKKDYKNNSDVYVTTLTTNSNGVAAYAISKSSLDSNNDNFFTAKYGDCQDSVSVEKSWKDSIVIVDTDKTSVTVGESVTVSVFTALYDGTRSANRATTLYLRPFNLITESTVQITTDANGKASYTFTPIGSGTMSIWANSHTIESKVSYVTVNKQSAYLSINVPLNLTYSDAFQISGTLTDDDDEPIINTEVSLKVGDTVVDTQTTDINGVATFTQTPVQTGNHSFTLVSAETSVYASATSSTVLREVGKETTVLTETSSTANEYHYMVGTQVNLPHFEFRIRTDDNEIPDNVGVPMEDEKGTLIIYNGDEQMLPGFPFDSNGTISPGRLIRSFPLGTHVLTFTYEGGDNYTSSSITKTVYIENPDLTVSSDKSTLSSYNNDIANITATLVHNNNGLGGEDVVLHSTEMIEANYSSEGEYYFGDSFEIHSLIGTVIIGNESSKSIGIYTSTDILEIMDDSLVLDSKNIDSSEKIIIDSNGLTYYDTDLSHFDTISLNDIDINTVTLESSSSMTVKSYELTLVTDANGQVSATYTSQGIGEVEVYAECPARSLVSETYSIEDLTGNWIINDDATADRSSSWALINPNNIGYSLTNNGSEYVFRRNGVTDKYTGFEFASLDHQEDVSFEMDFMITSANPTSGGYNMNFELLSQETNNQNGFSFGTWSSNKYFRYYHNNSALINWSGGGFMSINTWYHLKAIVKSDYVYGEISHNGIIDKSYENTNIFPNFSEMHFLMKLFGGTSSTQKFKNIQIRRLINFEDDATTDRSNSYDETYFAESAIFFSDGSYQVVPTSGATSLLLPFTVSNNVQLDVDVLINEGRNTQFVLGVVNDSNNGVGACSMRSSYSSQYKAMIRTNCTPTALGSEVQTASLDNSGWHHLTLKIEGSNVTAIINGVTKTTTSSVLGSMGNKPMMLFYSENKDSSFRFKNLKVKEL